LKIRSPENYPVVSSVYFLREKVKF
jgi:hypothetical protein